MRIPDLPPWLPAAIVAVAVLIGALLLVLR